MKNYTTLFLIAIFSCQLSAAIIYVSSAGPVGGDGTSWGNAFPATSLQLAIAGATEGDSIWVAAGTYYPTTGLDRSVSFSMRNNIAIIGSFEGNEASFIDRVLDCGPTSILSGNIGNPSIPEDNSYTIIVNSSLDHSAIIDGFQIRDGYDDRSANSTGDGLGGGVYNGGNGSIGVCSPTFRNCVIVNNYATFGAGMFNNGYNGGHSEPVLQSCILAFNTAVMGGGAMDSYGYRNGNAGATLINCIIYRNSSGESAGAIYCWGGNNGNSTNTIINTAIINNTAVNIAGGIIVDNSNSGSETVSAGSTAEVFVRNSIFWGNTALEGPQFFIRGSGHLTATHSNIDIINQNPDHPISGTGTENIFTDPIFLDTMNVIGPDGCWMTNDDGLNLLINSPNINAGDQVINSDFDIKGENRISGASQDIGPYEFPLPESVMWTGNINSEWTLAENWSPSRIPDSLQIVVIPNATIAPNQPVIEMNLVMFCKSLLLNTGATLRIRENADLLILDK